ncbi:MAG TPA: BTAD domain-containing putative transcriptional regulator [Burkholderiales bacterium]|nr:BTAD domain-containing putative transcriptional regulator [Burkholderiales bacterium]
MLAKLTPPKLSNAYPRRRLFDQLDHCRKSPVVWICGPPGAGKTTLVASYLTERKLKPLWYRLDEGDADPATLFYYLGAAAKQATPRKNKPLPLFTPEYLQGLPAFTRRYFRELYERLSQPFVVVFDNYHDLGESPRINELMQFAFAEISDGNVVVISRSDPPAELARLRVSGMLQIVNPESMRLTSDESEGIVKSRNVSLGQESLKRLAEQTQGWAAGVTLMCELGSEAFAEPAIDDGLKAQSAFDYFAGEIFQNTDRKTQDFLMETAFLPSVSAAIAEELTAHRDAGQILADLAAKNYFTLRDAEGAYHYHALFREFLLARAKEAFSNSRLNALKSDAAKLLAAKGMIEEAAELWRETEKWERLSELVVEQAPAMVQKGRNQTLEKWLAYIPQSFLDDQPWLLYWRATAQLPFDPARSQKWYERAFELFESRHERAGIMLAWAGVTRALRFKPNSDVAQYDHWIKVMKKLLADDPNFPTHDIEYQVTEAMVRAMYWRTPFDPDYPRWKERALVLAHACPDVGRRVNTLYVAAIYELLEGCFAEARVHIESAQKFESNKLPDYVQNFANMLLAYYQRETGQFETCLRTVETGLAVSAASGVSLWNFHLCGQGVYGAMGSDQLDKAEKLVAQMAGYQNVDVPGEGCWYHYLASWLAARRGDLASARVHAETAIELGSDWYFFQGMAHSGLASVLLELGDYAGARHHTEEMLGIGRRLGTDRLVYGAHLIRAGIAFSEGDKASVIAALTDAFALGRHRGYAGCAWWHRAAAAKLCAIALEAGIETEYARGIVRSQKLHPESPEIENWPWPLKVMTLGGFTLLKDDEPITFSRKAPKKVISLLKAIIALGGQNVPERRLMDALWPDDEGDQASEALHVNLHRLRKLLDDPEAIQVQEGKISLDPRRVWADVAAFERLLDSAEAPEQTQKALRMYRGAFLPEEAEEPWSVSMRERLRAKFIRHSARMGKHWAEAGQWNDALDCYLHGLEGDDLAEELYQGAMHCYQQLNRRAEALAVYRRMRQTLSITLGIKPSPASEALYRTLSAE